MTKPPQQNTSLRCHIDRDLRTHGRCSNHAPAQDVDQAYMVTLLDLLIHCCCAIWYVVR